MHASYWQVIKFQNELYLMQDAKPLAEVDLHRLNCSQHRSLVFASGYGSFTVTNFPVERCRYS